MSNRLKNAVCFLTLLLLLFAACCRPQYFREREAAALYREGQQLQSRGDTQAALEKFRASLAIAVEISDQAGIAHNYNEMAIAEIRRGDIAAARSHIVKAIAIYKKLEMATEVSKAINNLAVLCIRAGDVEQALRQYTVLLEWDRRTGNQLGVGITLNNMGQVLDRYLGRPGAARQKYLEALSIFETLGNQAYIRVVRHNLDTTAVGQPGH